MLQPRRSHPANLGGFVPLFRDRFWVLSFLGHSPSRPQGLQGGVCLEHNNPTPHGLVPKGMKQNEGVFPETSVRREETI